MTRTQGRDLFLVIISAACVVGGLMLIPKDARLIIIGLFLIVLGFALFDRVGKP